VVPQRYRGKPEFDTDACVGCGACVNVCPTQALTQIDETDGDRPIRKITLRYDTCIFCGNCQDGCTTECGIELSNQWDLAGLDRASMAETHEYELQLCEKCGAAIGTKKHLVWLCEKLGPLAYTNPSLLLAKNADLWKDAAGGNGENRSRESRERTEAAPAEMRTRDFMRILCPKCKCELNIRL
jgi:ferredoxin